MKNKMIFRTLLVLCLAMGFLAGCKYSRLVEFKDSLRSGAHGFQVKVQGDTVILFEKGILTPADVLALGYPPSFKSVDATGLELWIYAFVPKPPSSQEVAAFNVGLTFKEGRLTSVRITPELGELLSPEIITQLLRSVGDARVDLWRRELRFNAKVAETELASFPVYREVAKRFGPGLRQETGNSTYSVRYGFACRGKEGLGLAFVGHFRKHFDSMSGGWLVFGRNQFFFGEGFVMVKGGED